MIVYAGGGGEAEVDDPIVKRRVGRMGRGPANTLVPKSMKEMSANLSETMVGGRYQRNEPGHFQKSRVRNKIGFTKP